ncbi:MAG: Lipid A 3-O-deacylase (PagL) [Rhodobacteraceae bacterium HLUCCA08]|nr:MAG: Lipid A 3-O-deacylase (PagL) [Rhodobacteraceae bacterium HLUCCA08]
MDGTLATIYLIAGVFDMGATHCATGCLARQDADRRLTLQAGSVLFQDAAIGDELYLGYDLRQARGPFQPTLGLSVSDLGDTWIGLGVKTRFEIGHEGWFAEGSVMPGYHDAGTGPDLGGSFQIRSSLGLGYEFDNGGALSLLFDHRSNADTQSLNPGMETISIRYSMAFD